MKQNAIIRLVDRPEYKESMARRRGAGADQTVYPRSIKFRLLRFSAAAKLRHFACFMERPMRWRFSSTLRTTTFTTSPTLTTSLGWRRRRLHTSEICTRPS